MITQAAGLTRYDGAPMPPINNRLSMLPVDLDDDPTTTSSSNPERTFIAPRLTASRPDAQKRLICLPGAVSA